VHRVVTIETPELGDRSYLAHDGEVAVVVDPQRDIDRILAIAEAAGVEITHVAETHLHNDYVSGALELARTTGARYLVAAAEEVGFERDPVSAGDELAIGALSLQVVATPGHTPTHVGYVLCESGLQRALFSGGSLLYGSVGRTDLAGASRTVELARTQYRSVRALAEALPPEVLVLPTHGFGSFCSVTPSTGPPGGTIADEMWTNIALVTEDEDEFVERLVSGLTAYPYYYARMAAVNSAGPAPIDLSPARGLDKGELQSRIAAGEWVVDLRERRTFARSHLTGTVSFEHTSSFATYLGWVVPAGAPVTLIADSPSPIARAQRDLTRIGIDRVTGAASGPLGRLAPGAPLGGYELSDFAGLAKAIANGEPVLLDVRRDDEWDAGHIEGAVHVFLADLPARMAEIPPGEVWVHCASGYRSSIAASLLDRAGRKVVLISDEWARAAAAGLQIVRD
jgi:glyoxylase-like metal-dependent hydrolase (beta-lactamase superfamily II)/rhodanese-related sulfurtransferase